jgi:hypothetical protein
MRNLLCNSSDFLKLTFELNFLIFKCLGIYLLWCHIILVSSNQVRTQKHLAIQNDRYSDYYYYYYYGSTALCWALAAFSDSWSYTQSVRLLGRGINPSQGLYLHTEQHKQRIDAHNTDIHALSGIRTRDPNVRVSEDSSCLRLRGHCDRRYSDYGMDFIDAGILRIPSLYEYLIHLGGTNELY